MLDSEKCEKSSDEELAALILEDQDYFLCIIKRYKVKLFNYIRRITRISDEDAEDILQDIFLKVYLNLNAFDPDLKFSSWIYSIAHNQVISGHRKLKARAEGYAVPIDDDMAKSLASGLDTSKDVDMALTSDNIRKILDGLDEKYREVLVLKFIEEKSYQEISDILRKPPGTVGSMLNTAKKEFKKVLNKKKINF